MQGPLLQHKKEHVLHGDLKREDVVFQYTTTGWMMWNWLLGVLSVGATIVLFDGSPFKPDPLRIWHLVDELGYRRAADRQARRMIGARARSLTLLFTLPSPLPSPRARDLSASVTVFGTSAKYLAALEEAHIEPGACAGTGRAAWAPR